MKIQGYRVKNLSYAVIDNFYSEEELAEVFKELQDIKKFNGPASETGTSTKYCPNTKTLRQNKTGRGIFLDEMYEGNREASATLKHNPKIFSKEVVEELEKIDVCFNSVALSNADFTLINYYESGQEYKAHQDWARVSAVTFLRQGCFSGGEFLFPHQNQKIESQHNRMVVFPSAAYHQALPIKGSGTRISIAQFMNFFTPPHDK